jgi:hypothetical protein
VHAHTQAAFGEAERGGAAGDTGADDRDVDAAAVTGGRALWNGVFEPVGVQDVER